MATPIFCAIMSPWHPLPPTTLAFPHPIRVSFGTFAYRVGLQAAQGHHRHRRRAVPPSKMSQMCWPRCWQTPAVITPAASSSPAVRVAVLGLFHPFPSSSTSTWTSTWASFDASAEASSFPPPHTSSLHSFSLPPSQGWQPLRQLRQQRRGRLRRRRRPPVARRRRRRYRPRHRPCRAPSGCRRPPGAPCCGAARPTACWLAARTLRGPSPPAERVRRRRRCPLRRCPSRPVEPPRAGTGGYIKYYYIWSGSCMCMLKRTIMLHKRISSVKRL